MNHNPGTAMAPGSMGWPSYRQASPNGTPFHEVCHSVSRSCVMQVFNYVTLFQPNYETETESVANPEEFDKEIDPKEDDNMEEGEDIEHSEDRVLNNCGLYSQD